MGNFQNLNWKAGDDLVDEGACWPANPPEYDPQGTHGERQNWLWKIVLCAPHERSGIHTHKYSHSEEMDVMDFFKLLEK